MFINSFNIWIPEGINCQRKDISYDTIHRNMRLVLQVSHSLLGWESDRWEALLPDTGSTKRTVWLFPSTVIPK